MNNATLNKAQAHDLIEAVVTGGTADDLRAIAQQWNLAGAWNEIPEWSADDLHEYVSEQPEGSSLPAVRF